MKDFYRVFRQTPRSRSEAFRDVTYACSIYRTHDETSSWKRGASYLATFLTGALAFFIVSLAL